MRLKSSIVPSSGFAYASAYRLYALLYQSVPQGREPPHAGWLEMSVACHLLISAKRRVIFAKHWKRRPRERLHRLRGQLPLDHPVSLFL